MELFLDIVAVINFLGALTSIVMFIETRMEKLNAKKRKSAPSTPIDEEH